MTCPSPYAHNSNDSRPRELGTISIDRTVQLVGSRRA